MSDVPVIVPIVEGDGETDSCHVLLPHLAVHVGLRLQFARALNAHGRHNLLKARGLERFVHLAALTPRWGSCAKGLAFGLAERARVLRLSPPVAVVVAVPMYEAWLLGSLAAIAGKTIKGRPGIPAGTTLDVPSGPEAMPNPKRWLQRHLPPDRGYHETSDQPAFTAHMDFEATRASCRSFSRLIHALEELTLEVPSLRRGWVSPTPNREP